MRGLTYQDPGDATLTWLYVTASDNPSVWARVTTTSDVVALWQGEDTPNGPPIRLAPGEETTDVIVNSGPPPLDVLTQLYAGEDAALDALRDYVTGRGCWTP